MGNSFSELSQAEYSLGIKALEKGIRPQASRHFFNALDYIQSIDSEKERHDALVVVASRYYSYGFNDLALLAIKDASDLSEKLSDSNQLGDHLLLYGNLLTRMAKKDEAERVYKAVLERSIEQGDYINAAAASTNLSGLVMEHKEGRKAIKLLEDSLRYLKQTPHAETELNTRFALVQIMELEESDAESVVQAANELYARFSQNIRPEHRRVIAASLNKTVSRYLKVHPDTDRDSWTKEHIPYLSEWEYAR